MTAQIQQYPMQAVPGYYSSTQGIQIAIQTGADASDEDLQFFQQLGVEWAMVGINNAEQHSAEFYKGLVKRFSDINNAVGHWIDETYEGELTHGRAYSEDELWDNYEYMIRQIAPVAEDSGVRIGIHPDDPPVYALGGIPRCMFGNFEGYKRAMEIADSPNIGVCLCVGCWLEGGEAGMGVGVIDAIKHFAQQGQLFKVHFRNVSNPMPEPWVETLIDNGYQDMHQVMRALREVQFDGCIIPDHIPAMLGGHRVGVAYSIAYMRALVQAVNNEHGGPV